MNIDRSRQTLRIMTLLSPSFPVGAFSYSHGLEQAVTDGLVNDQIELGGWIAALLKHGAGWNDAVLLAESHRRARNGEELREVIELAEALAGSKERHLEQQSQGAAFISAALAGGMDAPESLGDEAAYAVAAGAIAALQEIDLECVLAGYLHAFASNQIQGAIRLGVLGQAGGVAALTGLEPLITDIARRAADTTLDDLGSCAIIADIMSMRHENLYSRIFRT